MSWTGKILRVDLSAGTCTSEPLNMQWANDYMGQRGLATKYLVEETDPGIRRDEPCAIARNDHGCKLAKTH